MVAAREILATMMGSVLRCVQLRPTVQGLDMSRSSLFVAAALALSDVSLRAASFDELVTAAVERGSAALRSKQTADGSFGSYRSGSTALAGLALLECGATTTDPAIQKAAASVRTTIPDLRDVYHLALAILFLDRVGEAADIPLIQVMTVRLLEGQKPNGAWSYQTPPVSDEEQRTVRSMLEKRELKTTPEATSGRGLDPDLASRVDKTRRTPTEQNYDFDNSNTQFAILGLWGGRRHAVPVDDALRRVESYFRTTFENGTWSYKLGISPRGKMAMTCAGLLGIAASAGAQRDRQLKTDPSAKPGKAPTLRDPLKDPMVQAALNHVSAELIAATQIGLPADASLDRDYYALWSLERVAMVYSLQMVGRVNWYRVGGELLLRHQQASGHWQARYGPEIDTCFALLFLKRSSLLPDLASVLRAKPEPPPQVASKSSLRAGPEATAPTAPDDPLTSLARELQSATADQRSTAIAKLRDAKGAENTEKLAGVISKLTGEVQKQVRDALAERLARMTADTLRSKLKDPNAELRRAAAVACALKEDAGLTADLIAVLDDKDTWVVRAAGVALRQLTGQDFGPKADATPDERVASVAAWKDWWRKKRPR